MFEWGGDLYLGDFVNDRIDRYDGVYGSNVMPLDGSCIWDIETYRGAIYASATYHRIYTSTTGNSGTWSQINSHQWYYTQSWELEVFNDKLYHGQHKDGGNTYENELWTYDGTNFATTGWGPDEGDILSMIAADDQLLVGCGREGRTWPIGSLVGKIYMTTDGVNFTDYSTGIQGDGIQCFLGYLEPVQN